MYSDLLCCLPESWGLVTWCSNYTSSLKHLGKQLGIPYIYMLLHGHELSRLLHTNEFCCMVVTNMKMLLFSPFLQLLSLFCPEASIYLALSEPPLDCDMNANSWWASFCVDYMEGCGTACMHALSIMHAYPFV